MKDDANTRILEDVWEALDEVRPPGEQRSLTDLGFVTAASTDGAVIRVLLTVPAAVAGGADRATLLTEVERCIGDLPSLSEIDVQVKSLRPQWVTADATCGVVSPLDRLAAAPTSVHSACVKNALVDMRQDGWEIDGFQQPRNAADRSEQVRVIIRARIAAQTRPLDAA